MSFAGIGNIRHEIWCGLKVPISVRDAGVSEIGAESQHVPADPRSPIGTVLQRPGGKSVPEVMQPWAGLPWPWTQAELAHKEEEGFIHSRVAHSLAAQRDKHMCLRTCQLLAAMKVKVQLRCRGWMKWDEPAFSKLRVANGQSVRPDVIDLKCERLRDPQPAGRQQPKEGVKRMRPQGSCWRELLCFRGNCGDFVRGEDMRKPPGARVMSKNSLRRNLMSGILRTDVACEEDEAAQPPRSLFQRGRA